MNDRDKRDMSPSCPSCPAPGQTGHLPLGDVPLSRLSGATEEGRQSQGSFLPHSDAPHPLDLPPGELGRRLSKVCMPKRGGRKKWRAKR